MTELEIEIELNRHMSDYYHEERMLRFRQNIKDAAFRGKMMDMKVMPVEKVLLDPVENIFPFKALPEDDPEITKFWLDVNALTPNPDPTEVILLPKLFNVSPIVEPLTK